MLERETKHVAVPDQLLLGAASIRGCSSLCLPTSDQSRKTEEWLPTVLCRFIILKPHFQHVFSISPKTQLSGFHYLCFILESNVFCSLGKRERQVSPRIAMLCCVGFLQKLRGQGNHIPSGGHLTWQVFKSIKFAVCICPLVQHWLCALKRYKIKGTRSLPLKIFQLNKADKQSQQCSNARQIFF